MSHPEHIQQQGAVHSGGGYLTHRRLVCCRCKYGGRPHWGKSDILLHLLKLCAKRIYVSSRQLAACYQGLQQQKA
jgi:hypothetical protein